VLEAAVDGYPDPNGRAMGLALIAHAAAGAGDFVRFESAQAAAEDWVAHSSARTRLTETLLFLSYAYRAVGDWERAEEVARKSYESAVAHGEAEFRFLAEAAIQQACSQEPSSSSPGQPPENPDLSRQGERLARELIHALAAGPDEPNE
jgi:hypothetical protein